MNPNIARVIASAGGAGLFEKETSAYLAKVMEVIGGGLPEGFSEAIDAYVKVLKSVDAWDTDDAHYILCNIHEGAARINLMSPNTRLLTVPDDHSAPTFTAKSGITPNDSYDGTTPNSARVLILNESLNSLGKYTQNSAHIALYSPSSSFSSGTEFGGAGVASFRVRSVISGGNASIGINHAGAQTFTVPSPYTGYYVGVRDSATHIKSFFNGVKQGSDYASASTAVSSGHIVVGGYYENGPLYAAANKPISLVHIGSALTPEQITARNSAVATLYAAIQGLTL